MKNRIALALCAAMVILFPQVVSAAALCCQISSSSQERFSGAAVPQEGEVTIQFNYNFTRMDRFMEGGTERSLDYIKANSSYTSLPVVMDMVKYTLTAGYGISPDLRAFVSVPYIRNTMDMSMYMMGTWHDNTMAPVSGLGDITVMALYRLYADSVPRPASTISLGLGLKTATGSFTETNPSGTRFIHAHMQPGTGSWDPIVTLVYTQALNALQVQADLAYQLTTENRRGYEFGDSFATNLWGRYDVAADIGVTAGLTYLHVGKASDKDGKYTSLTSLMDDPKNTGGDSLWLSPGVQASPFEAATFDIKVQLPVWVNANGIQLVTRYQFTAGLTYRF